jgi:hypothetical protein
MIRSQTCVGSRRSSVILVLISWHSGCLCNGAWSVLPNLTRNSPDNMKYHEVTHLITVTIFPFVPRNDDCHICFYDIGVVCDMSYTAVSPNSPLETVMNASDVIPDARARIRALIDAFFLPELNVNPALKLEAVLGKSLM